MSEFLVIIAFMDDGKLFRRRNISAVVENCLRIFPECDIVVSEHGNAGIDLGGSDRIRHMHSDDGDVFCKPKLLNAAVRMSANAYKAIVMLDADAYIDEKCVSYIREHWSEGSLVFPFGSVNYLNETDTRRVTAREPMLPGEKEHGVHIGRQTGLCNVFTYDTFNRVGGFDEDFCRWGAEDDAFLVKCRRLVGPVVRNQDSSATVNHLFHPIVNTKTYLDSPEYLSNRKRCACMRRMNDAELNEYVSGITTLGALVERYEAMGRLNVKLDWPCTPTVHLTIDTTIYDLDINSGMSFTKIMDEIAKEDGNAYAIEFIDQVLLAIPDLDAAQNAEIVEIRKKLCILSRT